jgi:HK97 family phage major capsid protein
MATMAASAKTVLFGDLSQYMIRDVMEVTLFRFEDSPYIKLGQIGFLAWARNDGKLITGGTPVKYLQQSAS